MPDETRALTEAERDALRVIAEAQTPDADLDEDVVRELCRLHLVGLVATPAGRAALTKDRPDAT